MKKSIIIRLCLFISCTLFYIWHISGSALHSMGLSTQHDITSIIAHNLGYQFEFSLSHPSLNDSDSKLFVQISVDESTYLIQYRLLVRDLPLDVERFKTMSTLLPTDPRIAEIIQILEKSTNSSIIANITSSYDHKCRMKSISAEVNAFGIEGNVTGVVDHNGMHLDVNSPTLNTEEHIENMQLNPDNVHGATPLLPPGIKPGDILHITPFNQQLRLEIGPLEDIFIHQKKMRLLHCSLNRNFKNLADIYASENGIIHQINIRGIGIKMHLEEVKRDNGEIIWSHDPRVTIVEDSDSIL